MRQKIDEAAALGEDARGVCEVEESCLINHGLLKTAITYFLWKLYHKSVRDSSAGEGWRKSA